MKINLKSLRLSTEKRLEKCDAPETDTFELIRKFLKIDKLQCILGGDADVDDSDFEKFKAAVDKRADNYPLQYIIKEWDFLGNTFYIDENVLCPRTETEQIADEAIKFLKGKKQANVLDLCCGSGCIGLTVAKYVPESTVTLCDISDGALDVTKENVKRLGLNNVRVFKYDLFDGFDESVFGRLDAFLCNPPYVTVDEMKKMQREVTFEPEIAVNGGEDGLVFYRKMCADWVYGLKSGGFFMFESGERQCEEIVKMLDGSEFEFCEEKDVCDVVRFVRGRRK